MTSDQETYRSHEGMLIANDARDDGQVGVVAEGDGVYVIVLPYRGCFPAGTVLSKPAARAIAQEILALTDD